MSVIKKTFDKSISDSDYDSLTEALSILYETKDSEMDVFESVIYNTYLMETHADSDIIMESVGDIFHTIVEAIKRFIEHIKEFFKKILLYITSAWMDLGKLADEVKKVIHDKDIDFTIDGYKFTVVDKSGPNMEDFQQIVSEYNQDMDDITHLKESEIKPKLQDWLTETNLDKIRAHVLGASSPIEEDSFLEEVRKLYRNGEDKTEEIKVDKSMVDTIISGAKRLEKVKREAIKDRDTLITLLSKTEAFFNKTVPTMYKNGQLSANIARVDVSDNKFKSTDNYTEASGDRIKLLTTYTSLKYRQVNKIASMINTVACERVNALKDQIKQERVILRRCLFGSTNANKPEKLEESVIQIFEAPSTYCGRTFDSYIMESAILEHGLYDKLTAEILVTEAAYLINSINSGEVQWLMEADMDSTWGKIKSAISQIIETIVSHFRKKAIGLANKYKPWLAELEEDMDNLKKKARAKSDFKMANFAEAKYDTMLTAIQTAITNAYQQTKDFKYDFAKTVCPTIDSLEKMNDDSSKVIMLNYFRTGKAAANLEKSNISGDSLVNLLQTMIDYIKNYGGRVSQPTEKLSQTLKTASDKFKVDDTVTESTSLSLLDGIPICESDIALCRDFNHMFGLMTHSRGRTMVLEGTGGGEVQFVIKQGSEASGTQDAPKAPSKDDTAQSDENSSAEAKKVEDPDKNTKTSQKKSNGEGVTYRKNIDRFFKNAISLYLKAREEQFIAYLNALSAIDGYKPRFDKNDKYIPKPKEEKTEAEQQKENEAAEKESQNATNVG